MNFAGYRCSVCGREYGHSEELFLCPKERGCLDIVIDPETIRKTIDPQQLNQQDREPSHWRYLPLLPVNDPGGQGTPLRRVGWTPVYSLPALRNKRKLRAFWLKDEGTNPTASLKDRASSMVVARAREISVQTVVTASTGNAGAALAGMAAALQLRAVVFAPSSAPPAKLAQMLAFGARVILVEGTIPSPRKEKKRLPLKSGTRFREAMSSFPEVSLWPYLSRWETGKSYRGCIRASGILPNSAGWISNPASSAFKLKGRRLLPGPIKPE